MVKASLSYRDFNDVENRVFKFYNIKFSGNEDVCNALRTLENRLIGLKRFKILFKRCNALLREVACNDLKIKFNTEKIDRIKSKKSVTSLASDMLDILKLKKENNKMQKMNKLLNERIELLKKEINESYDKNKKIYREFIEKFGFECKDTFVEEHDVNVENFESSLSDKEIYDKAKELLDQYDKQFFKNNIKRLKEDGKIK